MLLLGCYESIINNKYSLHDLHVHVLRNEHLSKKCSLHPSISQDWTTKALLCNIMFLGEVQSGKSSLIEALRLYAENQGGQSIRRILEMVTSHSPKPFDYHNPDKSSLAFRH